MIYEVYFNGIKFDSEYELRFVLSIEETHCYIYHPFKTYDVSANSEIKLINERTQNYTPDFLIRDLETFIAEVVEVKGLSSQDKKKRAELIHRHINNPFSERDYEFSWVNMKDKKLSPDKEEKFDDIIKNQAREKKLYFQVSKWIKPGLPLINPFKFSDLQYERFVRNGKNPRHKISKQ